MTSNQIEYQKHLENKRHNRADEGIKTESNRITEWHYANDHRIRDDSNVITAAYNEGRLGIDAMNAATNANLAVTKQQEADTNTFRSQTDRLRQEVEAKRARVQNVSDTVKTVTGGFKDVTGGVKNLSGAVSDAGSFVRNVSDAVENLTSITGLDLVGTILDVIL